MQDITKNFSPTNNFWEFNPAFKIAKPFKQLYNSDKSRGKVNSSNIMWAIALCYYPKSDLYYLNDKEARVFDMVKDKSFKLEDYKEHINEFIDMAVTQAEKSMADWENRMRDRDQFLKGVKYSLDYYDDFGKIKKGTADQLDRMAAQTHKLYQEYFKIKKDITEEQQAKGKGGKNKSLSDSGDI
jgi:hypothetical protein